MAGLSARTVSPDARRLRSSALFAETHPVIERLRSIDPNQLTPMEALKLLDELARMARDGESS